MSDEKAQSAETPAGAASALSAGLERCIKKGEGLSPAEADRAQPWRGMDGANAWHLIDRHAENWNEVGELMNAWLRANVAVEREACAKVCETKEAELDAKGGIRNKEATGAYLCAVAIRMRSNV